MSDSDDDEGMDAAEVADAEAAARMEGATVERIDTGRAAGEGGATQTHAKGWPEESCTGMHIPTLTCIS